MLKQAVILCGGYGTRLLPITKKIPKPMVNINGKPFLLYLIQQCKNNGIKKILLLCGYKYNIIKKYFRYGERIGVNIQYHYNNPLIETYKRIFDARGLLEKNFLLLYSDNYSSLNLHDLYRNYEKTKSKFIILFVKKKKEMSLSTKKIRRFQNIILLKIKKQSL